MPRFDYDNSGSSIASITVITYAERAGNHYILSNNHVLADSNAAEPGDRVL